MPAPARMSGAAGRVAGARADRHVARCAVAYGRATADRPGRGPCLGGRRSHGARWGPWAWLGSAWPWWVPAAGPLHGRGSAGGSHAVCGDLSGGRRRDLLACRVLGRPVSRRSRCRSGSGHRVPHTQRWVERPRGSSRWLAQPDFRATCQCAPDGSAPWPVWRRIRRMPMTRSAGPADRNGSSVDHHFDHHLGSFGTVRDDPRRYGQAAGLHERTSANSPEPPADDWGSRGRRFKSCQPDRRRCRSGAVPGRPGTAPAGSSDSLTTFLTTISRP